MAPFFQTEFLRNCILTFSSKKYNIFLAILLDFVTCLDMLTRFFFVWALLQCLVAQDFQGLLNEKRFPIFLINAFKKCQKTQEFNRGSVIERLLSVESSLKAQLEHHLLASPKFAPLKQDLQSAQKLLQLEESQIALDLASGTSGSLLGSVRRVKLAEIKFILAEHDLNYELQLALQKDLENDLVIQKIQEMYQKIQAALRARSLG
jgi:hypothetical protein